MSYPGNPELAEDVRRRVLSTFESMLREVALGNRQEALLGCSLIERMDPDFQPVTALRDRLEASGERGVELADLAQAAGVEPPEVDVDPFKTDSGPAGAETVASESQPEAEPEVATSQPTQEAAGPEPSADEAPTPEDEVPESGPEDEEAPAEDERIETVQTEPYEDTGERVELMSNQEFLAEAPRPEPQPEAESTEDEPAADEEGAPAQPEEQAEAQPEAQPGPEDDRVAALLAEGQTAFDTGEYQTAIDSWSRVFLIDLDHAEASDKIEEAKRLLAEREREAEELYHTAIEKLEHGDTQGARESLEATIKRQPGHVGAREHLGRLEAGGTPAAGESTAAPSQPEGDDLAAESQQPIPPPRPVSVGDVELGTGPSAPARAERKSGLSPQFLALAVLGLVVVTAGAWYLYSRRDSVFPNSGGTTAGAEEIHVIDRAQRQYAGGRLDAAITSLERVPATDPRHSEAQALLERWREEASAAVAEATGEPSDEVSPEQIAARAQLVSGARAAIDAGLYHRALERLDQAADILPLRDDETRLHQEAQEGMRPYGDAWLTYRDGDYRAAIGPLWRKMREAPDDPVLRDLLLSAQFNLARSSLISGNASEAAAMLSEAAKLAPRDAQILQALRFAEHYVGLPQDLRYRIFIRNLPKR